MDKLEFKIEEMQTNGDKLQSVAILINGIDIIERLKKYELPFAKQEGAAQIAGAYQGLSVKILLKNLTEPYEFEIDENGKVAILECECGCAGCWDMIAKITEQNDTVIWSYFEQPHRTIDSHNFWNYNDFGQFVFDKNNYICELNKLKEH